MTATIHYVYSARYPTPAGRYLAACSRHVSKERSVTGYPNAPKVTCKQCLASGGIGWWAKHPVGKEVGA